MITKPSRELGNCVAARLSEIPVYAFQDWRDGIMQEVKDGLRVCALFAQPKQPDASGPTRLYAILADQANRKLMLWCTEVTDSYPALTPECPQVHTFEREIAETTGLKPEGHPWLKPVRNPGSYPFYSLHGEEVHEVAVGPVHAGIIEPGHFRFQCHGENVFHLEIALGYQHRGVEKALIGGPGPKTLHYMEAVAGDTSVGHAMAYAQIVEALSGTSVPQRGQALRLIALELERLANHVGDLGALAGDVAYLPTASFCGRLRGDFLNLTAELCGNRLGRGLIRPGGVWDDGTVNPADFLKKFERARRHVASAVDMLFDSPSVLSRFENTGTLSRKACIELGIVGPAARACGIRQDVRRDFPMPPYGENKIPLALQVTGDVFARAKVRWLEIQTSSWLIREHISALPDGPSRASGAFALAPSSLVVSLVEGWRGEICHVGITDERGRFSAYKIVDPSFHNWSGLAMALRNQQISDFPLCNKSFNLSYCGHDL